MKKSLLKDSIREIRKTFKRFLSILLIVLLGVGFFAGIKATSPDMKNVADEYFDKQNLMDIEVMSTLGLTNEDIEALKKVDGVENVEAGYSFDAILNTEEKELVVKVKSLSENINQLVLIDGNMPENEDECVVEDTFLTSTNYQIGDYIEINPEKTENSDGEEIQSTKTNKLKIVGTIESPEYISRTRGTSKLGNGSINYYIYIPKANINIDVYTVAYITVKGANELSTGSDEYIALVDNIQDNIKSISDERQKIRYDEIVNNANKKLEDAQKEYDDKKLEVNTEISDAETKISNAKTQLQEAKDELASSKKEANIKFTDAQNDLDQAEKELEKQKVTFNTEKATANEKITEYSKTLDTLKTTQESYNKLIEQKTDIEKQIKEINKIIATLDTITDSDRITELNNTKNTLNSNLNIINGSIKVITDNLTLQNIEVSKLDNTIKTIESSITDANNQISDGEKQIKEAETKIESAKEELKTQRNTANSKFNTAQEKIDDASKEISENEEKLATSKAEAEDKLNEAQKEINDAKTKIAEIEQPEWYVLDRDANSGYSEYIQDTDRIGNLAKVFPIVFFLVAALISLTSMSRMIEEERVQIGTLKALGYNKIQISFKYIIYAFLATVIGGVAGMYIGPSLLPKIIVSMYAMMYTLPEITTTFYTSINLMGLGFALLCTIGATIYTCTKELLGSPANLMLPKAPKPGKRILLEKIGFIWSKMKFTNKVTARNIFRYKKKFLMTIIGVAGCTALIITGFGIRDSISDMIPSQYGEIFKYDGSVSIKSGIDDEEIDKENNKILEEDKVEETLKTYTKTINIVKDEEETNVNLIVPEEQEKISDFITLKSRTGKKESYTLDNDTVIITEKLASNLHIKKGDTITIKNGNDEERNVTVGGITENYLMHYMYMSKSLFNSLYSDSFKTNSIMIKLSNDATSEDESAIGTKILQDETVVSGITFLSMTKDMFSMVMDKMELVVYVLIVSAGLLAFAVLYNLSNVNISERIRELATIKVLGFYDKEVFNYITKETRILTAIGIILGFFGGYFLSMYILKTCELDVLMFDKRIHALSFVLGAVITIVFAEIVNIAVNHSLKKINMIDSLKSID